jgi:hypothetical protein
MMPQKTLDGKTDCRGVKGTCSVKFSGKAGDNPKVQEILDGLKDIKEIYPCVKITINRTPLKEFQKSWDGTGEHNAERRER